MTDDKPYIIAEAAQGYEGDAALARLLVRAAAAGGADAVKFQLVYADDLATPDYTHFDLFRRLEMTPGDWRAIRDEARDRGLDFYIDVFGPRALALAGDLGADGVKLHATCFFDDGLVAALADMPARLLLSTGGIDPAELCAAVDRHGLARREHATVVMYGFQAEPTPTASNRLRRIPEIARLTGLEVGFMDHSDGLGPHAISLSAVALGLGVRVFEKHISLDHALGLEDHVSALTPSGFAAYTAALTELASALGDGDLALGAEERRYREQALKRVVAARDLAEGAVVSAADIVLLRPAEAHGLIRPGDAIGRRTRRRIPAGAPVTQEDIE